LYKLFIGNNIFKRHVNGGINLHNNQQLTILQMNDSHAYIDLHAEMFIEHGQETYRQAGGYARIANIFSTIRNKYPNQVLALDNGDTFHGTFPAVKSKGEALIPMMNAIGFDAMTAHWEFAYGPTQFEKLVSMLDYPMLAANIYDKTTNERVFPPYTIEERSGLTIGVIGIAEHVVDKIMPPHFFEGIYFTLGNEELPSLINHLREEKQVDLIVVLSHFGFPQEAKLVQEVDGIDILLSGHTHNRMIKPVIINDTIIMQSGCHGSFIGQLNLEIIDGKIEHFHHKLIEVASDMSPDPHVQQLVDDTLKPYKKELDEIVGYTDIPLHRYAQLETTMDNLLLEALLDTTSASIAFSNGWRYGAPIQKGPITMNDLWNIIPTNPPVSTVEMTGADIVAMLEENIERTFASDPYDQMGGYLKRCLGMTLYIKLENPAGLRIQEAYIVNELLNEYNTYHVTFVTVQGVPKKYGTNRQNLSIHAIDALKQYVQKHEVVSPSLRRTV